MLPREFFKRYYKMKKETKYLKDLIWDLKTELWDHLNPSKYKIFDKVIYEVYNEDTNKLEKETGMIITDRICGDIEFIYREYEIMDSVGNKFWAEEKEIIKRTN
jgi:hypothetical protein